MKTLKIHSKFNLDLISTYRNELFGLSIIGIMIFHYFLRIVDHGTENALARFYHTVFSSVGVECFVFLSGMGLYFSMKKNSNIKQFYTKRLVRVLVPYVVWGVAFWLVKDFLVNQKTLLDFVQDLSFITFFTKGERVLWYIGFITVMYLFFPLIFKILDTNKHCFIRFALMLAVVMSVVVAVNVLLLETYNKIEVALNRVPVFLIGTFYGKRIYEHKAFNLWDGLLVLFSVLVHFYGTMQSYGVIPTSINFGRYEYTLFAIVLIFFSVWILSKINFKPLHRFLKSVGALSLELYMTHVSIDNIMRACNIPTYELKYYLMCVFLSIIFSIILHFSLKNITISIGQQKQVLKYKK